jgi:hypothetical protein
LSVMGRYPRCQECRSANSSNKEVMIMSIKLKHHQVSTSRFAAGSLKRTPKMLWATLVGFSTSFAAVGVLNGQGANPIACAKQVLGVINSENCGSNADCAVFEFYVGSDICHNAQIWTGINDCGAPTQAESWIFICLDGTCMQEGNMCFCYQAVGAHCINTWNSAGTISLYLSPEYCERGGSGGG